MSLETWKKKFYPVEANAVPKEEAIAHSYRKWNGLKGKAIGEHDLRIAEAELLEPDDSERFEISSETCALCFHYLDESKCVDEMCANCPIAKERGGVSCDRTLVDEQVSPYSAFRNNNDPLPMIRLLKSLVRKEANGERTP